MPATKTKAPRSFKNRLMLTIVGLVTFAGILGFMVLSFGHVTGSEFTPDRFARRDFAFYRIPLIRLQVSPVVRWDTTNDLETHLTQQKIIPKLPAPKRWDVVSVWAGSRNQKADAAILCRYLDTENDQGKLVWLEWTKSDQKRAKPFWNAVHHAAKLKVYYLVPDLFELAGSHEDEKTLGHRD